VTSEKSIDKNKNTNKNVGRSYEVFCSIATLHEKQHKSSFSLKVTYSTD